MTINPKQRRPAEPAVTTGGGIATRAETIRGYLATYRARRVSSNAQQTRRRAVCGKSSQSEEAGCQLHAPGEQPYRLQRMIAETVSMEFVTTHTEVEALLLEANLINQLRPRYNVLLRDDKSFPYILITGDHDFPQIVKHRGARKRKGNYFGPFATVSAVNRTITALQRAFLLRNCADTIFHTRSRPCLQYQTNAAAPLASIEFQRRTTKRLSINPRFSRGPEYQSSRRPGDSDASGERGTRVRTSGRNPRPYSCIDPGTGTSRY